MRSLKIILCIFTCFAALCFCGTALAEADDKITVEAESFEDFGGNVNFDTVQNDMFLNGTAAYFSGQSFDVRYVAYASRQGNYAVDTVCSVIDNSGFLFTVNGIEYTMDKTCTELTDDIGGEYGHYSRTGAVYLERGFNVIDVKLDARNGFCLDYIRFSKIDDKTLKPIEIRRDTCTNESFEYDIECSKAGYYDVYFEMNAGVFEQDSFAPVWFSAGDGEKMLLTGGTIDMLWQDASVTEIKEQSAGSCGIYMLKAPVYLESGMNTVRFFTEDCALPLYIRNISWKPDIGELADADVFLKRQLLRSGAETEVVVEAYNTRGEVMELNELRENGMVTFISSDPAAANVNAEGTVTAGHVGSAEITVNITDGKTVITKAVPVTVSADENGLAILDLDIIGDRIYINVSDVPEFNNNGGTAIIAQYADGVLKNCSLTEIDERVENENIISVPLSIETGGEIFVTVWDGMDSMVPVAKQPIRKELAERK